MMMARASYVAQLQTTACDPPTSDALVHSFKGDQEIVV
jgi:hypothetical protein